MFACDERFATTPQVSVWTTVVLAAFFVAACEVLPAADDFEREPISYSATIPQNVVSKLKTEFDLGRAHFDYDERCGYLPSLLRALHVPESSQLLVFSKTSFQRQRIGPKTPRALYFNDDVYIGYCAHGDVVEISAVDPKLGAVFYTLDQEQLDRPRVVRQACPGSCCDRFTSTGRDFPSWDRAHFKPITPVRSRIDGAVGMSPERPASKSTSVI
jgi:hypothetical protein